MFYPEHLRLADEARSWAVMRRWSRTLWADGKQVEDSKEAQFLLEGGLVDEALREADWWQDPYDNYVLGIDGLRVISEENEMLPYFICVPAESQMPFNPEMTKDFLRFAMGISRPQSLLGSGTRSEVGLIKWGGFELAGIYTHGVDVTGVDRMVYMNLLSEALQDSNCVRVPSQIFATTNFCVSCCVTGSRLPVESEEIVIPALGELDRVRTDLVKSGEWGDETLKIDGRPQNILRDGEGMLWNVDPILRNGIFVFG